MVCGSNHSWMLTNSHSLEISAGSNVWNVKYQPATWILLQVNERWPSLVSPARRKWRPIWLDRCFNSCCPVPEKMDTLETVESLEMNKRKQHRLRTGNFSGCLSFWGCPDSIRAAQVPCHGSCTTWSLSCRWLGVPSMVITCYNSTRVDSGIF